MLGSIWDFHLEPMAVFVWYLFAFLINNIWFDVFETDIDWAYFVVVEKCQCSFWNGSSILYFWCALRSITLNTHFLLFKFKFYFRINFSLSCVILNHYVNDQEFYIFNNIDYPKFICFKTQYYNNNGRNIIIIGEI